MQDKPFLSQLNPEQRKAVEQIYGPVLVLAGPGTGKTHMLISRIAHILTQTDTHPENILCLTFTNAAAVEMRERLRTLIGPEAYRIRIFTFHGFSEWIMENFPHTFQVRRENREIADDLQKALAFKEAVETQKWEHFSSLWDPFFLRREFLSAVSKLKREDISIKAFKALIPEEKERLESDPGNFYKKKFGSFQVGDFKPSSREKIDLKVSKMEEFAQLWKAYEEKLLARGRFDFDDQIMWVVDELKKNKNLRADLQEQFQWILVDEYQDTNSAQNEILWNMTDFFDEPNLFAVGDDDQSIYRFQGASVVNIQEFQKRFPNALQVTLSENYRSGQNILDAAFSVIAKNIDRIDSEKSLQASGQNKNYEGGITKASFGSRYSEISFLVDQIREAKKEGVAFGEMAILVRKNSEIQQIARLLPQFDIPVSAQIFENIFDDINVRHLISMLEIFATPDNDEKFIEMLHAPFWKVEARDLLSFSREQSKSGKKVIDFLIQQTQKESDSSPLKSIFSFLVESRKSYWHCRPLVLAEKLLYESGLAAFLSREENKTAGRDWQKVQKFLSWIREQNCDHLSEILERVKLHTDLQISIRPDSMPSDRRTVHILTAHSSKGREFDVVFMPGLEDKKWGNPRSVSGISLPHILHDEHDENEDERRLFFVAMTRTKKKLYLSYCNADFSGREKSPSQFFHEVLEKFSTELPFDETESSLASVLPTFLSGAKTPDFTAGEKEVLKQAVSGFIWSATSLQTFLDCPRKFLYQYLYKFPRRPTPGMGLGTALHQALERSLKQFSQTQKLPSVEVFLSEFERALRGQNLEKKDFEIFLEHGKEVLSHYYHEKKETFSSDALLEFHFEPLKPSIGDIRITGKMDKVVFLDEAKSRTKIVDYKSGKPRAIRKGESLWRQLVFYDLLAKNSKRLPWKPEIFELDFLTPGANGKLGTRSLEVSEEERQKVTEEVKTCHERLLNLEFPLIENIHGDPDIDFWQNFGQ